MFFVTLCASCSKVLILFRFDLISSSSNLSWHCLYTWVLLRCLFTNLKRRNFGIAQLFLQSNKNLRSKWYFHNIPNIWFVFQTKCKISNFFTFKDKIPPFLHSGIVYKFQCPSCNATYYGKIRRYFKVRMCEHLGISALTGKRIKGDDDSAIKEHLLFCNYTPDFEDFSILATNNNDFKVTLMESLLINRDHPFLWIRKSSLYLWNFLTARN